MRFTSRRTSRVRYVKLIAQTAMYAKNYSCSMSLNNAPIDLLTPNEQTRAKTVIEEVAAIIKS